MNTRDMRVARRHAHNDAHCIIEGAITLMVDSVVASDAVKNSVSDAVLEILEDFEGDPQAIGLVARILDKMTTYIHHERVILRCEHQYNDACGCADESITVAEAAYG
jgi:hypothetical protein